MKKFLIYLCIVSLLIPPSVLAEDRSIILVTSKGVYQADVINGIPGAFVAKNYDVIVQGVSAPNPVPDPPPSNDTVDRLAEMSLAALNEKRQAVAMYAMANMLGKRTFQDAKFEEVLVTMAEHMDGKLMMDTGTKLRDWARKAVAISKSPAEIKAGLVQAWGLDIDVNGDVQASTAEAVDFEQIMEWIMWIFDILVRMGVIK